MSPHKFIRHDDNDWERTQKPKPNYGERVFMTFLSLFFGVLIIYFGYHIISSVLFICGGVK